MTNETITADVRISNWTLATGTRPGARDVYSPARDGAKPAAQFDTHVAGSLKRAMEPGDDNDSNQVVERAA
jgi:hypothetical protein